MIKLACKNYYISQIFLINNFIIIYILLSDKERILKKLFKSVIFNSYYLIKI